MNSANFRAWLVEQGCHIDRREGARRGHGQAKVHVHREGRTAELPEVGSHAPLAPETIRAICEALDLDSSKLPGFTARH